MKIQTFLIKELVEVPAFKDFYSDQPLEDLDLLDSYTKVGQKTAIHVNSRNEIINGYRMINAIQKAGGTTVDAIVLNGEQTIHDRTLLNKSRPKSLDDKVKETKLAFEKFSKQQGKKNNNNGKYRRDELIAQYLGYRFKGDKTIHKLEFILKNDIENDTLSKGIIDKNWKVDTCHQFLKEFYPIDIKKEWGFTKNIINGSNGIDDTIKLIKQKLELETYRDTFIIPDKVASFNINCLDLAKKVEYRRLVDLLLTSPPFFNLRNYINGDSFQIGHEKTREKYCENVTNVIKELLVTLKESANVIINIGETYNNGVGCGIPQLLKHYIEINTSLIYKDTLIWSKPNPKPQNEIIQRPINNVEYLLWFVVDPKKAKYNLLKYSVEGRDTGVFHGCKDVDKNGMILAKNVSLTKPYKKIYSHIKEQDVLNIIECSVGKNHDVYNIYKEGHPAIMSALLPIIPVLMTTDEEDLVLDPFSGSNVVSRISLLLNRRILSTELSKEYFKIGCRMLENSVNDFNRHDLDFINKEVHLDQQSDGKQISTAA